MVRKMSNKQLLAAKNQEIDALRSRNEEMRREIQDMRDRKELDWRELLELVLGGDAKSGLVKFIARRMVRGARA